MKQINFEKLIKTDFEDSYLSKLKKLLPNEDLNTIKEIVFDDKYKLPLEKSLFLLLRYDSFSDDDILINNGLSFYGDNFCIKPFRFDYPEYDGYGLNTYYGLVKLDFEKRLPNSNFIIKKLIRIEVEDGEEPFYEAIFKFNILKKNIKLVEINPFDLDNIIPIKSRPFDIRHICNNIQYNFKEMGENDLMPITMLKRCFDDGFIDLKAISFKDYLLDTEETLFLLCKYDKIDDIDDNIIFWSDYCRVQKTIINGQYDFVRTDIKRPFTINTIVPKNLDIQKH